MFVRDMQLKIRSFTSSFYVSNIFEDLVNHRLFDRCEKCGLFSDFRYVFRSRPTAGCVVRCT